MGLVAVAALAAACAPRERTLVLLSTNDMHAKIQNFPRLASAVEACRDTAQLAFGEHAVWTPLNSFFDARGDERVRHTEPVWALVAAYRGASNPMLVTHQVNITAASGVFPAPGQIVALQARQGAIMAVFSFNPLS